MYIYYRTLLNALQKRMCQKYGWCEENLTDIKEVIGWMLGAGIAVAWISWAILDPGNMVGLVIALAVTILLGTASGGLIALSKKQSK